MNSVEIEYVKIDKRCKLLTKEEEILTKEKEILR